MRIAIEAITLSKNNLTGIGNVVYNYINELMEIDKRNTYVIYSIQDFKHIVINNNNWSVQVLGSSKKYFNKLSRMFYILISYIWLPLSLKKNKIDLYIGTSDFYYPLFLFSKLKKILIVYDIVWKLFPETMSNYKKIIMNLIVMKNLKMADLLIAISKSTGDDVKNKLKIETKIITIPLAADNELFYESDKKSIETVKRKYSINKKIILSVCTLEPRKNLISLLKSFSKINNYTDYQLVLVGNLGWIDSNFFSYIDELGIRDSVIITGFVDSEDLSPLYSGSEVFVYPSLYEGFGLPVLEAMQCGCPVITSNSSSLPEVIGEAGIKVNPEDIESLTAAIEKVLSDSALRRRMKLDGIKRSMLFSWEKSAKTFLKQIKSI